MSTHEGANRSDSVDLGDAIEAITFDFGNTLVPFTTPLMTSVVESMAGHVESRFGFSPAEFERIWLEERDRQIQEDVPEGREADMDVRAARVIARLRGAELPPPAERWDDVRVATWSTSSEVEDLLDSYAAEFVRLTPVPPEVGPLLAELAERYVLGILSNWPLAIAIERYADNAGWSAHLAAVVTSQRIGVIKPDPGIFYAAARQLGVTSGPLCLHVGDDLGADVGGARAVNWRAGWVRPPRTPGEPGSPLPVAPVLGHERPDFVIERVTELPQVLGLPGRSRAFGRVPRGRRP